MKKSMQKVYKTIVFEIILQKGIEQISPFLTCPILCLPSIYKMVISL